MPSGTLTSRFKKARIATAIEVARLKLQKNDPHGAEQLLTKAVRQQPRTRWAGGGPRRVLFHHGKG